MTTTLRVSPSLVSDSLRPHGLYSPLGSSVHGILQARILEWVVTPSSRGLAQPRDQTQISCISCRDRQILHLWATWEAHTILVGKKQIPEAGYPTRDITETNNMEYFENKTLGLPWFCLSGKLSPRSTLKGLSSTFQPMILSTRVNYLVKHSYCQEALPQGTWSSWHLLHFPRMLTRSRRKKVGRKEQAFNCSFNACVHYFPNPP